MNRKSNQRLPKKNCYEKFKDWCNANQGLLTFIAVAIAFYAVTPFQKLDFTAANSFFEKLMSLLSYTIVMPVYILIATFITLFFYLWRIKRRYQIQTIAESFLVGTWKNEWLSGEIWCNEILKITEDLKYMIAGEHCFNITDFKYNAEEKRIEFIKVAVRPNDTRKLSNILTVKNNDMLVGFEDNAEIKYSRISS